MPTTHTVTTYKFNGLSDKAKARAIKERREQNWKYGDDSLQYSLQELFSSKIHEAGWMLRCPLNAAELANEGININWSLASCQGDGVCFYHTSWMSSVELARLIETAHGAGDLTQADLDALHRLISCHGFCFKLRHQGHYSHYNSIGEEHEYRIDKEYLGGVLPGTVEEVEKLAEDLAAKLLELAKDLCKELEKLGYAEIEYRDSDEYIKEDLASLDDDYFESGRLACLE